MVDTPPIIPPKVITPVTTTITSVGQQQNPPLWNFPQGAVLKGNVTAVNPDGTVKIETNAAQLLLRTQFPLAKNAQVSIRLEQPFTNDSMPHIRILTVNGTPALQVAQQQQAAQAGNPQVQNNPQLQTPVQNAAQAAELAKPVGVLLEIAARNTPANAKGAAEGVPVQNPNAANVRPTAAEVNLTPMQSLPAVLVRPSISPQALVLLPNLPLPAEVKAQVIQGEAGAGSSTNAMPVNAAQALLKPGLQLQVRLISTVLPQQNPAAVLPAGGAPLAPTPVPAHVTPAQTAGALPPAVNVPTGAPPLSTALPQAPLPPVATPLSDRSTCGPPVSPSLEARRPSLCCWPRRILPVRRPQPRGLQTMVPSP